MYVNKKNPEKIYTKRLVVEVPVAVHKQLLQIGVDQDSSMREAVRVALGLLFERLNYPTDVWN
jgi:hypothetical protein